LRAVPSPIFAPSDSQAGLPLQEHFLALGLCRLEAAHVVVVSVREGLSVLWIEDATFKGQELPLKSLNRVALLCRSWILKWLIVPGHLWIRLVSPEVCLEIDVLGRMVVVSLCMLDQMIDRRCVSVHHHIDRLESRCTPA